MTQETKWERIWSPDETKPGDNIRLSRGRNDLYGNRIEKTGDFRILLNGILRAMHLGDFFLQNWSVYVERPVRPELEPGPYRYRNNLVVLKTIDGEWYSKHGKLADGWGEVAYDGLEKIS